MIKQVKVNRTDTSQIVLSCDIYTATIVTENGKFKQFNGRDSMFSNPEAAAALLVAVGEEVAKLST